MEAIYGQWTWDYTHYTLNYEGRIALNLSLRFGLGGLLFVYVLKPLLDKGLQRASKTSIQMISYVLLVIFSLDVLLSIVVKFIF